jgi:hypothetical protein
MTMRILLSLAILPFLAGCLRSDAPAPRLLGPIPASNPGTAARDATHDLAVRLGVVEGGAAATIELLHHHADGEVVRDPTWRWSEPPATLWHRALTMAAPQAGITLIDSADAAAVASTLLRFGTLVGADGALAMSIVAEVTVVRADHRVDVFTVAQQVPIGAALPGEVPVATAGVLGQAAIEAWHRVHGLVAP